MEAIIWRQNRQQERKCCCLCVFISVVGGTRSSSSNTSRGSSSRSSSNLNVNQMENTVYIKRVFFQITPFPVFFTDDTRNSDSVEPTTPRSLRGGGGTRQQISDSASSNEIPPSVLSLSIKRQKSHHVPLCRSTVAIIAFPVENCIRETNARIPRLRPLIRLIFIDDGTRLFTIIRGAQFIKLRFVASLSVRAGDM